MRRIIVAVLGALVCPNNAQALDCGISWNLPVYWQRAAGSGDVSTEQLRRDTEARATLESLDRTPILFRGRVASARYLSDPHKASTAASLIVFDHVQILKGRLPATSRDRKAFILREQWCDGNCSGEADAQWPIGETVLMGAHPDKFAKPSKAVSLSKLLNHRGRVDAVVGMCGGPVGFRPWRRSFWMHPTTKFLV